MGLFSIPLFFGLGVWLVRSYFEDQELNPGPSSESYQALTTGAPRNSQVGIF